MSIELPDSIAFGDLLKTHEKYNPICPLTRIDVLTKHRDLYEGGANFRKNIKHYLFPRQLEEGSSNAQALSIVPGTNPNDPTQAQIPDNQRMPPAVYKPSGVTNDLFERRARRSAYAPIGSGMVDFMKAAIFQEPAELLVTQAEDDVETSSDKFWKELNVNANGKGKALEDVLQDTLQGVFLDFRAYLLVTNGEVKDPNATDQKARGELDSKISYIKAKDVTNWWNDERGNLSMILVHRKQCKNDSIWLTANKECHSFIYITAEQTFEYYIEWLMTEKQPDDKTEVKLKEKITHGATYQDKPCLPIIQIDMKEGLWLMERLSDIILSLFNRQSAATWSLDQMAFAIFVIASNEPISNIMCPDIGAIKLRPTETATFEAPETTIHTAQLADIDRLTGELSLVIQAMVLVAAAKDDQGRKSGISKKLDFTALTTLLSAYATPLRRAVERAITIIKEYRDEETVDVKFEGLKNFDVMTISALIENINSAWGRLSPTAKAWAQRTLSLKICDNAPDAEKQKIQQETKEPIEEDATEELTDGVNVLQPDPKESGIRNRMRSSEAF